MTDTTDTRYRNKEFTIVRVIDATREVIWRAWTDPDEASHWLHPQGVSSPRESIEYDVREGGTYRYTMVNDSSGEKFPTGGTYIELVRPERLVFTWGKPGEPVDTAPLITITLDEEGESGDSTKMTFRLQGFDGQPGDGFVHDGWTGAFVNLNTHVTR
jgi:uncharacterized protein YndB with AHSA1/START domain